MVIRNTNTQYGMIAKTLHWLIFLMVLGMLIVGFLLGDLPKAVQPTAYNAHKVTGVIILFLMGIRLSWAMFNSKPDFGVRRSSVERMAERLVHGLLYAFLIAMPLSGWVGSSSAGKAPHWGDWHWALPVASNKPLIETAFDLHEKLAIAIIIVLSIHVLAVFYHYVVRRENVLKRML